MTRLRDQLEKLDQFDLDEIIFQLVEIEASSINNCGIDEQEQFILKVLGTEELALKFLEDNHFIQE